MIAALTHDMERHFPGRPVDGPRDDAARRPGLPEEPIPSGLPGSWASGCAGQGAAEALVAEVERLVLATRSAGSPDEDLLQAADSLSFLEVNGELVAALVHRRPLQP